MRSLLMIAMTAGIAACGAGDSATEPHSPLDWQPVAGNGVHYFSTAIVHERTPTESGLVQRSTDSVDLEGDLIGRVLYHPKTTVDNAGGSAVTTGHQVYSGTIRGSVPLLLYTDDFRFDVDLASGAVTGSIHFNQVLAGPAAGCELDVVGTGMTPAGDATFDYSGRCYVGYAD